MIVVAIDPGVRALGWARADGGRIVACGVSRVSSAYALEDVARAHAAQIRHDAGLEPAPRTPLSAVVESMRWRPNDPASQPNDLLDVQTVGAIAATMIGGGFAPRLVRAQEWKRNLPKAIMHARLEAVLSEDEREIVRSALARAPKANAKEILDACGISVYASGRVDDAGRKIER